MAKELKTCIICGELKAIGKNRRTCNSQCAKKYRVMEYRKREELLNGL